MILTNKTEEFGNQLRMMLSTQIKNQIANNPDGNLWNSLYEQLDALWLCLDIQLNGQLSLQLRRKLN